MTQTAEARTAQEKSTWPTAPFYLMSKLELMGFVLTPTNEAENGSELNVAPIQESKPEIQLWQAIPDKRGGAILKHIVSGKCLSFDTNDGARKVFMTDQDRSNRNQLWELADFGDEKYSAVHPLADQWKNLNVRDAKPLGTVQLWEWQKDAPNESWMPLTETGNSTIVGKIDYHTDGSGGGVNVTPGEVSSDHSVVDNSGPNAHEPITGKRTLSKSHTKKHQITESNTKSAGLVFTQNFEISGGVQGIFTAKVGGGFQENSTKTVSLTNTDEVDESTSSTFEVDINVPAGKIYDYEIVETIQTCSVPYTAHMQFKSSVNEKPRLYAIEGRIDNSYSTGTTLVVKDITHAEKHLEVTRKSI